MRIQLSDHFTYRRLLRFVLPSIVMMIFTSIYGVIDGLFVSNYVGKTPFAALNLIFPFIMMMAALGFMLGTGGSALVSKTLGEGETELANQRFSLLVGTAFLLGVGMAVLGIAACRPIALFLGADEALVAYCVLYGRILMAAIPAFMLQNVFQSFFVTAQKPAIGLAVTTGAGLTNIVLDFLLIAVFRWGLAGAAIATAMSQVVGGILPLLYFFRSNDSLLHLTRPRFEGEALLRACTNGASELMNNISMSFINMLYNFQLMKIAGEDGVSAYGVMMYLNFVFVSIFLGYSIGSAPIVGYHYGAQNRDELKNMLRKSIVIVGVSSLGLTAIAELFAHPLAGIFVGYDAALFALTAMGLRLYALSYLFNGFNIFGSAFFTALNNGAVSAAISFLRTLLFQSAAVLLLPLVLGVNGIWLAIVAAELLALAVTLVFLMRNRKKYGYA